jgi:hypothetical protein
VFVNICRAFAEFRDYRGRTVKHPLFGLLMILLLSRIAGCRGWDATADWAAAHDDLFRRHLPVGKTPPGADTLRRTAQAYALEDFLEAIVAEGETVHIDGKRLRGAGRDGTVHHLVEALCGGQVIGLVETGAGAEGPAIQELVADLDLAGRLVTIDAAGTTPAVAAAPTSCSPWSPTSPRCSPPCGRPSTKQQALPTRPRTAGTVVTRRAGPEPSLIPRSSPGCPPRPGSPASAASAASSARASPRTASSRLSTATSAADR